MVDNVKQVIVMISSFPDGKGGFIHPRKGKLIAQGCHASISWLTERCQKNNLKFSKAEKDWLNGSFTKICVKCEDEKELLEIFNAAKHAQLEVHLITDAGLTEFGGVPTKTCLAIGPDLSSKIDSITGNLKLL